MGVTDSMGKTEFSLGVELLPLGNIQEYLKFREFIISRKELERTQEYSEIGSSWEDQSCIS